MSAASEVIRCASGIELLVEIIETGSRLDLHLSIPAGRNCRLHWGLVRWPGDSWSCPPEASWPEGTVVVGAGAVQTPFLGRDGKGAVQIRLERGQNTDLAFVLFFPDEGRWDNNEGKNYFISASSPSSAGVPQLEELTHRIVENETGRNSWTLMHRYNLCYELLDKTGHPQDELALLFVWLRYSAIRQLDWQRNYNTKPRELAHAMDRLTWKLAGIYARKAAARELVRLMLATMGRGGQGQRIRDEILEIMHRHHIKEVSGQFMEEWHQKMHNNTTPDDIVICEAYLEFLRSNGDVHRFYRRLEAGGVTRARLESFERPVKTPPDFVPHIKDGLIRDLEHFLGTLKSVHAATDLGIALQGARSQVDREMHGWMDFIWHRRDDSGAGLIPLVETITKTRLWLAARLDREGENRELLYLDIALEDFLRVSIERAVGRGFDRERLCSLLTLALRNFQLAREDEEIGYCSNHWERLSSLPAFQGEWNLHVACVLNRLERAVAAWVDRFHSLLQPRAERLGKAFGAAPWSIAIFSEEVMRGGPAFILATLAHRLEDELRRAAGSGAWHAVSGGAGAARVMAVHDLASIQGRRFDVPVAVVADRVVGNEEIGQGVKAVLTMTGIDMLSHVAIRARNARILLATCYDPGTIQRLKSLDGRFVEYRTDAAGEVTFRETTGTASEAQVADADSSPAITRIEGPDRTRYALNPREFNDRRVGGKSLNLTRLTGRLPEWIHLPRSVALPFGIFEEVLEQDLNRSVRDLYRTLEGRVDQEPPAILPEIRSAIRNLRPPGGLSDSLQQVMREAGLAWPDDWSKAWRCILQVWASKWNARAYWSRKAHGIRHEDLYMAVLIQEVVPADYAFVIHTVHPLTGNRSELYGEAVLGLGEVLVGNYPGRALSFAYEKSGRSRPRPLAFCSKSVGLFGGGLIFRSDSNAEDLAVYAGAGLYDSVLFTEPGRRSLDYSLEPLLWDGGFRDSFLTNLGTLGCTIEDLSGAAQDIEGAYSGGRYFVVQTRPQVGIPNG